MKRGIGARAFVVAVLALLGVVAIYEGASAGPVGLPPPALCSGGLYGVPGRTTGDPEVDRWLRQAPISFYGLDLHRDYGVNIPIGDEEWAESGRALRGAEEVLGRSLRSGDAPVERWRTADALKGVASRSSVPLLIANLREVWGGVTGLGRIGDPRAVPTLCALVAQSGGGYGLGRIGDPRAVPWLRRRPATDEATAKTLRALTAPDMGGRGPAKWPLHEAVRAGDADRVRVLLAAGEDPNLFASSWGTPLVIASELGHAEIAEALLSHGAEACDSALYLAAKNGHEDVAKVLLAHGASPHTPKALHMAAWFGHLGVMDALLAAGADLEGRTWDADTPLHWAAYAGSNASVRFLLEKGANPDTTNYVGWSPLGLALAYGHVDTAEALADWAVMHGLPVDPELVPYESVRFWGQNWPVVSMDECAGALEVRAILRDSPTWVQEAAREGKRELVMILVRRGVRVPAILYWAAWEGHARIVERVLELAPDTEDWALSTALHAAVRGGHAELAALLLARGADIWAVDYRRWTPLYWAACLGHTEMVQLLLSQGVYVGVEKWVYQDQALREAVQNRHKDVVGLLLEHSRVPRDLSYEKWPPVQQAVENGDAEMLRLLFAKGAEVNADSRGGLSLFPAVYSGRPEAVSLLLEHGADVNARKSDGATPLHMAALLNEVEIARLLIAAGADVDARTMAEQTPLHTAATFAGPELVDLLLANGASVDSPGFNRETPLHQAALGGNREVAELLLRKGAAVNARDSLGRTPLHGAVEWGQAALVELLIAQGAGVNVVSAAGETPLHLAVKRERHELVRTLLDHGADPEAGGRVSAGPLCRVGLTPLDRAVWQGSGEMTELLLSCGAKHDVHTAAGLGDAAMLERFLKEDPALARAMIGHFGTPLHWAARWGHEEAARMLLAGGADPNARTGTGDTPLHMAVWHGHRAIVELLLANGADPNAAGEGGETPLHLAARRGEGAVAELLLAAGAKADVEDSEGKTPLEQAVSACHKATIKTLLAHGGEKGLAGERGVKLLSTAVRTGQGGVVKLLLAAGADPNAPGTYGSTALDAALYRGNVRMARLLVEGGAHPDWGEERVRGLVGLGVAESVRFLLEAGADPNGPFGEVPLRVVPLIEAVEEGQESIVEVLLAGGADPNVDDRLWGTPLDAAVMRNRIGCAELLIKYGADVNAGKGSRTALRFALEMNEDRMAQLLRDHGGIE